MAKKTVVRTMPARTVGSGVTFASDWAWSGAAYHGARTARGSIRRPYETAAVAAFVAGLFLFGSFFGGIAAVGVAAFLYLFLQVRSCRAVSSAAGASWPVALRAQANFVKRHRLILRRWPLAAAAGKITAVGSASPPRIMRTVRVSDDAIRLKIAPGRIGRTVDDVRRAGATVAEVIGAKGATVTSAGVGVCEVQLTWTDPLAKVLPLRDLPVAERGQVAYGIRPDGSTAAIYQHMSVLYAGLTRAGKSSLSWAMLADLNRQQTPTRVYASDCKGVELAELEARLGERNGSLEVRQYASTPGETREMVESLLGGMEKRKKVLKASGRTKLIRPDEENPLTILLIDELLPLEELLRKGASSPLGMVASQGAALGYVIWAGAQVGQIETLGRLRTLIPQRISFSTDSPESTDAVLGKGAESRGALCSLISTSTPGIGYSYDESQKGAIRFRGAKVTDLDRRLIAAGGWPTGMPTERPEPPQRPQPPDIGKAAISALAAGKATQQRVRSFWESRSRKPADDAGLDVLQDQTVDARLAPSVTGAMW